MFHIISDNYLVKRRNLLYELLLWKIPAAALKLGREVDSILHELTASGWKRLTGSVWVERGTERLPRTSVAKKTLDIF